jgi:hypothetical protein
MYALEYQVVNLAVEDSCRIDINLEEEAFDLKADDPVQAGHHLGPTITCLVRGLAWLIETVASTFVIARTKRDGRGSRSARRS